MCTWWAGVMRGCVGGDDDGSSPCVTSFSCWVSSVTVGGEPWCRTHETAMIILRILVLAAATGNTNIFFPHFKYSLINVATIVLIKPAVERKVFAVWEGISFANMRCYTSLDLSTRASVQCGRGYSCLKVTRPSQVFSRSGRYVPPDRRPGVTTLYRGCFVLDILKVDTQDTGVSTWITSTQSYILTICCTNIIILKTFVGLIPYITLLTSL